MNKIWIMPIAGNGTRTRELGEFKPFIEINDKKIIEWFLISIIDKISNKDKFIFITTQYFNDKFNIKHELKELFSKYNLKNKLEIVLSDRTPQGPAKSVELALNYIQDNYPIIIINVDQFLLFNLPEVLNEKCYLVSNVDIGESKSYIEIKNKKILEITEKVNNSNIASTGVYIFPNKNLLVESLTYIFENKIMYKDEYYIATAMNSLIGKVKFDLIPALAKLDLGTVENVNYFKNIINLLCDKNERIIIDSK